MHELYVYYKVAPGGIAATRAAFAQLRAVLCHQWPDLRSRLLMRPAAAGAQQTWMEIHVWPEVPDDVPEDWIDQLERHAGRLAELSVDGRHVEVFVALD